MKLATLCYVRKDGKTLMVHRNKKPNDMHLGKWNGLGGKLEPGETPEECCIRELYEETGLHVRNPIFKGMITFPAFDTIDDWYTFLFVITEFSGELSDSPEGVLEWVPDEHLLELNLWEGDLVFLPWLDRPGFFSAKFVYEDYRFVSHEVAFYHDGH